MLYMHSLMYPSRVVTSESDSLNAVNLAVRVSVCNVSFVPNPTSHSRQDWAAAVVGVPAASEETAAAAVLVAAADEAGAAADEEAAEWPAWSCPSSAGASPVQPSPT